MEESLFADEFNIIYVNCVFLIEFIFQKILGWFPTNENFFFVATEINKILIYAQNWLH